ncbi:MAG TPA: hypothetical protein V6C82_01180, partial [Chroococcales cyanobacterium]
MASVIINPSIGMRLPQNLIDAAKRIGEEGKAVVAPTPLIDPIKTVGKGILKHDLNSISTGAKAALPSLLKAGRNGAIFSGAVSLLENAYKVFKHERTLPQAGGLVVADTAIGAVGGVAAATASGIGMAALGAIGLAGLPLTLVGGAIGMAAFFLVDRLFKNTGLYKGLADKVTSMFEGSKSKVETVTNHSSITKTDAP